MYIKLELEYGLSHDEVEAIADKLKELVEDETGESVTDVSLVE